MQKGQRISMPQNVDSNSTKDLEMLHFVCDQRLIPEYKDTSLNI